MTCRQLGGACDSVFTAETFEEIVKLSQEHGKEMYMANDKAHIKAMEDMRILMQDPKAMNE